MDYGLRIKRIDWQAWRHCPYTAFLCSIHDFFDFVTVVLFAKNFVQKFKQVLNLKSQCKEEIGGTCGVEAGKLSASASAVSHPWLKTHHQVTFLDILMSQGLKFLKGLNGIRRINPDNKDKFFVAIVILLCTWKCSFFWLADLSRFPCVGQFQMERYHNPCKNWL